MKNMNMFENNLVHNDSHSKISLFYSKLIEQFQQNISQALASEKGSNLIKNEQEKQRKKEED